MYGEAVSCGPTAAPSTLNCTQATPTLSEAVALSVIVPLSVCPPIGDKIATEGGTLSINKIVSEVDWELAPTDAVRVADCDALTTAAAAVKSAIDDPEAAVTEAGTATAAGLLLLSEIVIPPCGDGWLSVTVQVDVPPELTVIGEQIKLLTSIGAWIESVVDDEPPFSEAVTVAVWGVLTVAVVAINVFVDVPEATITEAGTDRALELLLARVTAAPPAGAF